MKIINVTITPNCRLKTDEIAIDEALAIIKKKLLFTMSVKINDNAKFEIIAELNRT